MGTTIRHARIFDGEAVVADADVVVIDGGRIVHVGRGEDAGRSGHDEVIDADGATLLPGLIDAHTHSGLQFLADALAFGVTTELDMGGPWTAEHRAEVAHRDDLADVRTAGFTVRAPGGHPNEMRTPPPGVDADTWTPPDPPSVSTPAEAVEFVDGLHRDGSDYVKLLIEHGEVFDAPHLTTLDQAVTDAAVEAAHRHNLLAVAHAFRARAVHQALDAGVDGLAHAWLEHGGDDELVARVAESGVFVTACLCVNRSILGAGADELADDPRVAARMPAASRESLRRCYGTYLQGSFDEALATVGALHRAGVDVLAGTDSTRPEPQNGGVAHGASLHHELALLVQAGLTPLEALRAATSVPARRFGLTDRGRIGVGMRADLVLVDGDPASAISDTLSIREVWRRGVRAPNLR